MMRHQHLDHRFVEHLPDRLDPGVLYLAMEFGTVAHSCCCGCGTDVYTPLTPTDWSMTYDGETVSLNPSVGNWHQKCRSHYVIRKGKVIEAGPWSEEQVASERERDRAAKERHYGKPAAKAMERPTPEPAASSGIWSGIKRLLSRWI